jgi:hypothetical protein
MAISLDEAKVIRLGLGGILIFTIPGEEFCQNQGKTVVHNRKDTTPDIIVKGQGNRTAVWEAGIAVAKAGRLYRRGGSLYYGPGGMP